MKLRSDITIGALKLLMRPIVKFCIKYSLRVQDFIEVGKSLFVELAVEELNKENLGANKGKISIVSGLHRRDVVRLLNLEGAAEKTEDIISKIIGQWQSDKRFVDSSRKPKELTFGFEKSEFSNLVKLTSNDVSASAVLMEMTRIGGIEKTESKVRLIQDSYLPKGNPLQGFKILSEDIEDLKQVVEGNVIDQIEPPHMQFRTVYDCIDPKAREEVDLWLFEQGKDLHLKAREFLSQFDLDINPGSLSEGAPLCVTLSSFSLVKDNKSHASLNSSRDEIKK